MNIPMPHLKRKNLESCLFSLFIFALPMKPRRREEQKKVGKQSDWEDKINGWLSDKIQTKYINYKLNGSPRHYWSGVT